MKHRLFTDVAVLAIASCAAATAATATETNIWATSFDDPLHPYDETTGPWVNVSYPPSVLLLGPTLTAVPSDSSLGAFGSTYLQGSGLDLATFTLSGVGLGTGVQPVQMRLQFDLAFEDGWDPSGTNPATDGFAFSFNGTPVLWNAANDFGTQAGGPGSIISSGSNVLGGAGTDTVVHYDYVFTNNMPSILLGFQLAGAPFIPIDGNGPAWGLDNISLHAISDGDGGDGGDGPPGGGGNVVPGVPEPASWALLIAGFGVIGVALRRNNRATVASR